MRRAWYQNNNGGRRVRLRVLFLCFTRLFMCLSILSFLFSIILTLFYLPVRCFSHLPHIIFGFGFVSSIFSSFIRLFLLLSILSSLFSICIDLFISVTAIFCIWLIFLSVSAPLSLFFPVVFGYFFLLSVFIIHVIYLHYLAHLHICYLPYLILILFGFGFTFSVSASFIFFLHLSVLIILISCLHCPVYRSIIIPLYYSD